MLTKFRTVTVPFENLRVDGEEHTFVLFGTAEIAHDGRGSSAPVRFTVDAAAPGLGPSVFDQDSEMFSYLAEAFTLRCGAAAAAAINRDLARGGHVALFGEFRPNAVARQGRPPYLRRAIHRLPTHQRPRELRVAATL